MVEKIVEVMMTEKLELEVGQPHPLINDKTDVVKNLDMLLKVAKAKTEAYNQGKAWWKRLLRIP